MSRGLGKVQRVVLEYLRQQGGPCAVSSIAWSLANVGAGIHERPPSRALRVSVERAARSLARAGLLCTGRRGNWGEGLWTVAWLPEQAPPKDLRPARIAGSHIERIVLDTLLQMRDPQARTKQSMGFRINLDVLDSGAVAYQELVRLVLAALDRRDTYGIKSSITRAIQRLQARGQIKMKYERRDNRWKRYIVRTD
jgi:hypothetical protein